MKAVIIEDEAILAEELLDKLKNKCADVEVIETLPSLKTAKRWFMNNAEPDLLLMDIQLSDGVSFELFENFQINCPVIFTTAYDEFALKAFKSNGVDYLLKPVDEEELAKAIDKCRAIIQNKIPVQDNMQRLMQQLLQTGKPAYKETFIIHKKQQWLPVYTKDVALFLKENLYYVFTFNSEKHILNVDSIEEIESAIDPQQFYRANRQTLVNVQAIEKVQLHENQKLTLILKQPLKVTVDISREKASQFKKWFDR